MLRKMLGVLVLLFVAIAVVETAYPYGIDVYGIGTGGRGLTKEDLEMVRQASAELYQNPKATVGMFNTWENPQSGNSGTVMLIKQFQAKGLECWRLRHNLMIKVGNTKRQIEVSRCKAPDGTWKIL